MMHMHDDKFVITGGTAGCHITAGVSNDNKIDKIMALDFSAYHSMQYCTNIFKAALKHANIKAGVLNSICDELNNSSNKILYI